MVSEKIAEREARIQKEQERVAASQAKIAKLKHEVETLKSLEIQNMLREIGLPFPQVIQLIKSMSPTPMLDPDTLVQADGQEVTG